MKIDIITLFPQMFESPFSESIVKRAQEKGLVEINIHDLRKWTDDKRKTVDDKPFGGGAGMVLKVEPVYKALKELRTTESIVILTTPQGEKLEQSMSKQFSTHSHLIILCGHYEGIDERIRTNLIDREISIGDYVLTGGELPAMVIIDSIVRLIPGVLGKEESFEKESFEEVNGQKLLEYPQNTQPAEFST
jgi:tRNA (guanine37-N1)-methyltransferase